MSSAATLLIADFSWGWDALVAIGTLALAAVTAWLAWSTRALARASRNDERAQWRPVLVPDSRASVDYDEGTGVMAFEVRNVGRGPAFGVNAQIRTGKRPIGASIPGIGGATALAPHEGFRLQARVSDRAQRVRGLVIEAEVSYYDITERWHRSIFTIVGRRPPDKLRDHSVTPQLEVAKVFVYETERYVLPVLGSPKAREQQAQEQRSLRHRGKSAAALLLRRERRESDR